jgi:hypothetical protein
MRPLCTKRRPVAAREDGIAMIVTLMVLVLVSALMVGFTTAIIADQRASGLDRDQTQAYAAAHAGLEQLTSDLSGLFAGDFSPTAADIANLTANPPVLEGFDFVEPGGGQGYRITFNPDENGNPAPEAASGTTLTAGPYQGLRGLITPYDITVTARSRGRAEVRMRRTLQTVAMPVFQFGVFSDADVGFHAEQDFDFGGRVHTNANLYLAQGGHSGNRLTLSDRVTAVGEIIRTHLVNGVDGDGDYRGTVRVIKNAPSSYRTLARTEGSLVTNDFAVQNEPLWTSLSVGTYASNIRNGRTGARRLDLPLVAQGATPIEVIRRPALNSNEHIAQAAVYNQRFFGQASIRILLSDTAEKITNLPTVTATAPVPLGNLTVTPVAGYTLSGPVAPFATSAGGGAPYASEDGTPLLGGFIKIEQRTAGGWQDVTLQILKFGITGRRLSAGVNGTLNVPGDTCGEPNPNAIIRLQRVKDVPGLGFPCGFAVISNNMSNNPHDYWPNALYDTREGNVRDNIPPNSATMYLGGVMQYIEIDIGNLKRWIEGDAAYPGGTGPQTFNEDGYIVYFSDRRLNRNDAGNETGEYGFEDVVNPGDSIGATNNGLDAGEDVNGNGTLDHYGRSPILPQGVLAAPWDNAALPTTPWTPAGLQSEKDVQIATLRANRQVFFRRALKVVNGGLNRIPSPGLTIASENPVYVQGDFNANGSDTNAEPNMACAIIADAVTLLSNGWNDIRSFVSPNNATARQATTTGFRMGIIAGKSMPFPRPAGWTSIRDFGTDGGAHDFLRTLESWGTLNYRGSLVSFYRSRQAVGTYKSGVSLAATQRNVFSITTRSYTFDTDFLVPTQLPPGTPAFRDVNTLTFRQLLRPTQ